MCINKKYIIYFFITFLFLIDFRIPDAGSFIRISKANTGISCPSALRLKYGKNEDKPPTFINLPQKTGQERHIEMVGMEKIMGKQR